MPWTLSAFVDNNLASYVCKLAMLVYLFFCCVAQNEHTTQPSEGLGVRVGLPSHSTLTMSSVLWHSGFISHLHTHRRKAVNMSTRNCFPRPNQGAAQKKLGKHLSPFMRESHVSADLMLLVAWPRDTEGYSCAQGPRPKGQPGCFTLPVLIVTKSRNPRNKIQAN